MCTFLEVEINDNLLNYIDIILIVSSAKHSTFHTEAYFKHSDIKLFYLFRHWKLESTDGEGMILIL